MKVSVKQQKTPLTDKHIDTLDGLVIVLPTEADKGDWPSFPYSDVLKRRLVKRGKQNCETPFSTELPTPSDTQVTLVSLKPNTARFGLLTLARKLAAATLEGNPHSIALYTPGVEEPLAQQVIEALVTALLAAVAEMPDFKSKKESARHLKTIHIYGLNATLDLSRCLAETEGNALARHLTSLPPNELTPGLYRKRIAALARQHGWKMEFLDLKTLTQKNAGAFLAVAQSSHEGEDGIVHLRYTPKTRTKKPTLALVGKGICFDTGGNNLKPAKHMFGMHEDMAGSAVALGTLLALTQLKADFPVDCWLALTENLIGPKSYKQNQVVTAANGVSIEVVHTDAEGRMVLADTLVFAGKDSPGLIIDYATLTGSCIGALGTRYSGAFTNRNEWIADLIEAGRDSGERVWPFPTDSDYDKELESQIADIKQCTMSGDADHILAARFLSRFVKDQIPWIHIDLASASHKGGLAHIPTDTTGFGVRYTLNLLLERHIMQKSSPASKRER